MRWAIDHWNLTKKTISRQKIFAATCNAWKAQQKSQKLKCNQVESKSCIMENENEIKGNYGGKHMHAKCPQNKEKILGENMYVCTLILNFSVDDFQRKFSISPKSDLMAIIIAYN